MKFRIKIEDRCANVFYLEVSDSGISFQLSNGAPQSLSNIAGRNAVPLRYALEDAEHVGAALAAIAALAPGVKAEAFDVAQYHRSSTHKMKYGRTTLADTIAQIVHFAHDDYASPESTIPADVVWNVSYVCACFLAQHTVDGFHGVETEFPWAKLRVSENMLYEQRLLLAVEAVEELGGERAWEGIPRK